MIVTQETITLESLAQQVSSLKERVSNLEEELDSAQSKIRNLKDEVDNCVHVGDFEYLEDKVDQISSEASDAVEAAEDANENASTVQIELTLLTDQTESKNIRR